MNVIFVVVFLLGGGILLFFSPENFLPVLLRAGEKAATLCVALLASYCVWMGLMQVMTDCGLTEKLSRCLRPLTKKLFGDRDEETLSALTMNLSANLLGLGGVATPYGIRAATLLEGQTKSERAHAMLFVLAATSLQLLPTTVVSLLTLYGATDAYSIILPSLLSSMVSTLTGVILVQLLVRK